MHTAMAPTLPDDSRGAFLALLEQHRGIVVKVAHSYCRNQADRDDLCQEIVAQLWSAFPRFDSQRVFSTWMYRIALNVAISHARRAGHPARTAASLSDSVALEVAAPEAAPADPRLELLETFMQALDPLSRALLVLYLEDRSYREIADVLGITETNVATKISRLKIAIRQSTRSPQEGPTHGTR